MPHVGLHQTTAVVRRPARCRTWACTGSVDQATAVVRRPARCRTWACTGSVDQATAVVRRPARCRTWACTRPPQWSGGPRGAARGPAPDHRSGQAARAVPHVGLHQATAVVRRPARCRTWACTRPPQGSGGPRGAASLYAALLRYIQKLLNCGAARRLGLIKVVGGSLVI